MKVFLLSNDDLSSSLIFGPLFDSPNIEIAGLAFSKGRTSRGRGRLGVFRLLAHMTWRYWAYLVFVNGCFKLLELTTRRNIFPERNDRRPICQRAVAQGVPVHASGDFSSPAFIELVRRSGAELLLVRVDQILSAELLKVTRHGTWCVHSSLLPSYGGIAGEFQALRCGEATIGSTVFRVEPELDRGPALRAVELSVVPGASVFSHTLRNNRAAGRLLVAAVEELARTGALTPRRSAVVRQPSYFSWPRPTQVAEARREGIRLIGLREAWRWILACLGFRSDGTDLITGHGDYNDRRSAA